MSSRVDWPIHPAPAHLANSVPGGSNAAAAPRIRTTPVIQSVVCLALTLIACVGFLYDEWGDLSNLLKRHSYSQVIEVMLFILIVTSLISGNVLYQVTRIGYLRRSTRWTGYQTGSDLSFRPWSSATPPPPMLTILVPAYREEPHVVWQTLMSAALLDHPHRRVVLLLDDRPPVAGKPECLKSAASRRTPEQIKALLAPIRSTMTRGATLGRWLLASDARAAGRQLATLYDAAAVFLDDLAAQLESGTYMPFDDHTRRFFVRHLLHAPAAGFRADAAAVRQQRPDPARMAAEFDRLSSRFAVELDVFERKRFANLPHASNKAANLNAYLGLIGRSLVIVNEPGGRCVRDAHEERRGDVESILHVPDTDFVLTLDADSFVTSDYASRLLAVLADPAHARVAVAQTPYSVIPGADSLLERVAGATTDLQYIVHQGMAEMGGGFWVGANALLRMSALRDIATWHDERGHLLASFIQDRTLIEDTGSTIDLVARGWKIHNHPMRLAYSATPHDFGALLIQRRRWANGGLIILPDLIRYLLTLRPGLGTLAEAFVRLHYLCSPTVVAAGTLALIICPFNDTAATWWLPMTAIPYFVLYAIDLQANGHRWSDMLRVYALNLLLLPVMLGGVLKSLEQIVFGTKTPFGRTPKIESRTAVPIVYLAAELGLAALCASGCVSDLRQGCYGHAAFSLWNAVFFLYGCGVLIGPLAIADDVARMLSSLARGIAPRWSRSAYPGLSWRRALSSGAGTIPPQACPQQS